MKKFLSLLLAVIMVIGMFPVTAFAEETDADVGTADSEEPAVIFTSTDFPMKYNYIGKIVLRGVKVEFIDGFDIYLSNSTAKDAKLDLEAILETSHPERMTVKWNGSDNSTTYSTNLVDGKATVEVFAQYSAKKGTKVFNFYVLEENEAPVLAEGYSATAEATITSGESYGVNLDEVFYDADGDALSYTVSVNGEAAAATDAEYVFGETNPGTYVVVFTATDGKISEDKIPTHTLTVTVINNSATYEVGVTVPEGVSPKFYAVNEINEGEAIKGDELVYENGAVKVPENISVITWEAEGLVCASVSVSENAEINLVKTTFAAKLYSGEKDENAAMEITGPEGAKITGKVSDTYLLPAVAGFTYKATASVSGYNPATLTEQTPVSGEVEIDIPIKHFTVIAPKGSVVSAGTASGSFKYNFAEPIAVETVDETVVYKFAPLSGSAFVRVQNPDNDAVTYWDWKSSKADGKTITITESRLFMNDAGTEDEYNSDTVYRNFEKYEMDLGDIYMNINNQGYINLNVGDVKGLNMFRNWQAIEGFTNNKISLPDFEYEIITIDGDNVISIIPDENNSAAATLTANGEGTAIVLVTYDAMYSDSTVGNASGGAGGGNRYSAIWPDRTGVFVVSVGKDGTAIQSNMTCNGAVFDAEHSPQFYIGDKGASVSFIPEEGVTVTVNRSTVGKETLTFGEFTSEGVSVDAETGEVTVSGLKNGRHIIRFEKDGVFSYQVVTATETTAAFKNSGGEEISADTVFEPGDTITITVTGLTNPAEKFATKYNFNAQITYKDQLGNEYSNSSGTGYGKYNFSACPQTITVTIPEDWARDTLVLNGYIRMGGFAGDGIGSHRKVSYGVASDMAHGADAGMVLGTLPTITLNIDIPATEISLDKTELELACNGEAELKATVVPEYTTDEIVWESSDKNVVTVDENGKVTAVGVGEATVTVKAGNVSAVCTVTVAHDMSEATCTKPATCKHGCGHTEGEALGHDYGEWVTVEEPTETEGGRKVRICSVCGHTSSKYIKPLGDDGITVIVPGEKYEGESNPNTGAPVCSAMSTIAVLAAAAIVLKKINKK